MHVQCRVFSPECITMVTRIHIATTVLAVLIIQAIACKDGWFGSKCQYLCHCTENRCDDDGRCVGGAQCVKGWFGLLCQFVDLSVNAKTITNSQDISDVLQDGDDCSCLDNLIRVSISWKSKQRFRWMRLVSKDEVSDMKNSFTLQLNSRSEGTVDSTNTSCNNETCLVFNNKTLDVFYQTGVMVDEIVLEGHGIKSLCSVYISGGRNIAVEQTAHQTSDFENATASLAIDGNTDGNYFNGSCSHTGKDGVWNLYFTNQSEVNKVILYNREDFRPERLLGFEIKATCQPENFFYKDREAMQQRIYTVIVPLNCETMSHLNVKPADNDTNEVYLTLCEVEIFGELTCPDGYYGLECKQQCKCPFDHNKCNSSTGGCLSGGASDYQAVNCTLECDHGTWGNSCSSQCNVNCKKRSCNRLTGHCDLGCKSGYTGLYCTDVCPQGTWGFNCSRDCDKCIRRSCDSETGECYCGCKAGYQGLYCDAECDDHKWGYNCSLQCNANCENGTCNSQTGKCTLGCAGTFKPPYCTESCDHGTWGKNCSLPCNANCKSRLCDSLTGQCDLGCKSGYTGLNCTDVCDAGRCNIIKCKNDTCDSTQDILKRTLEMISARGFADIFNDEISELTFQLKQNQILIFGKHENKQWQWQCNRCTGYCQRIC